MAFLFHAKPMKDQDGHNLVSECRIDTKTSG
jgi:hypothetical protein